jgi:hypothetical protein
VIVMMTMTMTTVISSGLHAPAGCVRCVFSQNLHRRLPENCVPLVVQSKVVNQAEA